MEEDDYPKYPYYPICLFWSLSDLPAPGHHPLGGYPSEMLTNVSIILNNIVNYMNF